MRLRTQRRRPAGGFSLLELIVVVTIISVIAGATVPMASKFVNYQARKATRAELAMLADASAQYFEDVGKLPDDLKYLLGNPGSSKAPGWSGPYLLHSTVDELTQLDANLVDSWSRAYEVSAKGDVLTITSHGQDGKYSTKKDIRHELNVAPIRRAKTQQALVVINQAVTRYNGIYMATEPLSGTWSKAFGQLTSKGMLPNSKEYQADAWGDEFVSQPKGQFPVVRIGSSNIASTP